ENDLRAATDAQAERERREVYASERRKAADLVQKRKFDEAIQVLQALLIGFPDDPLVTEDLSSAKAAKALQDQREGLNRRVEQLEKLYRKGEPQAVKEAASRLLSEVQDPRVRELLHWAETEIAREAEERVRESTQTLRT